MSLFPLTETTNENFLDKKNIHMEIYGFFVHKVAMYCLILQYICGILQLFRRFTRMSQQVRQCQLVWTLDGINVNNFHKFIA